jgi:hypothetical protein
VETVVKRKSNMVGEAGSRANKIKSEAIISCWTCDRSPYSYTIRKLYRSLYLGFGHSHGFYFILRIHKISFARPPLVCSIRDPVTSSLASLEPRDPASAIPDLLRKCRDPGPPAFESLRGHENKELNALRI